MRKVIAFLIAGLALVPPGVVAYLFDGPDGVLRYLYFLVALCWSFCLLHVASRLERS